jgi:hypothetical protein
MSNDGDTPVEWVTCRCCCREDCIPVYAPLVGADYQKGGLSELNHEAMHDAQDTAEFRTSQESPLYRLPDRSAVVGPCGSWDHTVCVACIRAGVDARDKSMPLDMECLGGCNCRARYGPGLRWCFDPDDFNARQASVLTVVVDCPGCGQPRSRPVFELENSQPGDNVRLCPCGTSVCFDCGKKAKDGTCEACDLEVAPPLRPSLYFPDLDNRDVTAAHVVTRAREVIEDRGECVRCIHCGLRMVRINGCKVLTHCGTEVCIECNARGQRTTGQVRRCCRASGAPPPVRTAMALTMLLGTVSDNVRRQAVHAMRSVMWEAVCDTSRIVSARPSQALGVGHNAVNRVGVEV